MYVQYLQLLSRYSTVYEILYEYKYSYTYIHTYIQVLVQRMLVSFSLNYDSGYCIILFFNICMYFNRVDQFINYVLELNVSTV